MKQLLDPATAESLLNLELMATSKLQSWLFLHLPTIYLHEPLA